MRRLSYLVLTLAALFLSTPCPAYEGPELVEDKPGAIEALKRAFTKADNFLNEIQTKKAQLEEILKSNSTVEALYKAGNKIALYSTAMRDFISTTETMYRVVSDDRQFIMEALNSGMITPYEASRMLDNLERTLEACARVKADFRLALAGQGPHEKEVRRLAEELGLSDRVLFTGHIGDADALNALFRRAALFLFPSRYDTSGLVVREAAAMGTPSVVVRGSSAAEGIRDGENGFLCADDPGDLARVIEAALADPDALARIGEHARDTIPIPWSKLVDDVLENYARLIREHPSRR